MIRFLKGATLLLGAAVALFVVACGSSAELQISAVRTYRLLDGYRQYYCVITAANPGSSMVPVSSVDVGYYDGQGNQIETGNVYLPVTGIAPGRSVSTNQGDLPGGTTECRALSWSS